VNLLADNIDTIKKNTETLIDASNDELRDLNYSPSIIRIIKSMRMRWADHVARMGEKMNASRERDH
jgi:hypothetical protein